MIAPNLLPGMGTCGRRAVDLELGGLTTPVEVRVFFAAPLSSLSGHLEALRRDLSLLPFCSQQRWRSL